MDKHSGEEINETETREELKNTWQKDSVSCTERKVDRKRKWEEKTPQKIVGAELSCVI